MSMHVLGINLAPLLTVGGISGIVVGLSAQVGTLANAGSRKEHANLLVS